MRVTECGGYKNGLWAVWMAEGGPQVYKPQTYSSVWPLIITPELGFIIVLCPWVFGEQRGVSVDRSLFTRQSVIHHWRINYIHILKSIIVRSSVCLLCLPAHLFPFVSSHTWSLLPLDRYAQFVKLFGRCALGETIVELHNRHSSDCHFGLKPYQTPTATSAYHLSSSHSPFVFLFVRHHIICPSASMFPDSLQKRGLVCCYRGTGGAS